MRHQNFRHLWNHVTAMAFAAGPVTGRSGWRAAAKSPPWAGALPRLGAASDHDRQRGGESLTLRHGNGRGLPDSDEQPDIAPGAAVTVRGSNLYDFNIALQVRIPVKRWEPYGMLGTAVLMNPYTAGIRLHPARLLMWVNATRSLAWRAARAAGTYVGERWGVRAEYRYTSSARNFNRIPEASSTGSKAIRSSRFFPLSPGA